VRNKLFHVLGGFAVTLATLAAPANCHAQSIRESVLKLSTADVEIILNNSQRPFQAPNSYQTSTLRKRVMMGLVIGTAGGMVAGIPLYRYCSNEGGSGCGRAILYFGALGAGIGAAIGATR